MYYRKYVRNAGLTNLDPLLADLSNSDCGQSLYQYIGASEVAQQYSAKREFPLLRQRLIALQRFVLSQNPSDWDGLRHDRRDIRQRSHPLCCTAAANTHIVRYYTFWAVVWVGGMSIVLSLIQCILSFVQMYYSIK